MPQVEGYILRISSKELADHVFDMAIYYTNLNRKWRSGQNVFFVQKTELGDAFIGIGAIETMLKKNELCDQERLECEQGKWKWAVELRYVRKLERLLPVKETFLKDSKLRGKFLHGLQLNAVEVAMLLKQTGEKGLNQKS